jgi:phage recombination protein Bet
MSNRASTEDLKNRMMGRQVAAPRSVGSEISYESENGATVTLSPQIVRQYLVNGQGNVTDQEVMMFLQLCKYQGLNPFLREAYLIKYGDRNPASIVVGKEVYMKRAERHPEYQGLEAGVIVMTADGEIKERPGTFSLKTEQIVGGWAKVYRQGHSVPAYNTVEFDEYAARKADGQLNNQWSTKPGTMIRKCAVVATLREAFPAEFGGMYSQEEINTIDAAALPTEPINIQPEPVVVNQPDSPAVELVSEKQARRMFALSNGNNDIVRSVLEAYNYASSKAVTTADYQAICTEIEAQAQMHQEEFGPSELGAIES